jgi:hypothetical protein
MTMPVTSCAGNRHNDAPKANPPSFKADRLVMGLCLNLLAIYTLDAADDRKDQKEANGMKDSGHDEGGSVAVGANQIADEKAEEHAAEGTGGPEQSFHRPHDARRENVGWQRLDVGGPKLMREHGGAEKNDGEIQR